MCQEKHPAAQIAIVEGVLSRLPVIRVYIPVAVAYGDSVNAYNTVQRYLSLGYRNIFEIVYSQTAAEKVGTLFGIPTSDLITHDALQSWHPQIRFVKEEAFLKHPHLFQHVLLTIAGTFYSMSVSTLKTDLFIAPDNGSGMIMADSGNSFRAGNFNSRFGRQILFPIPTINSIKNLLTNTHYGKMLGITTPGISEIVDRVAQEKINTMIAYGMDWSFWLPSERMLAKITTAVCQVKTEQPSLQKPTLILVLNHFSWWHWRQIRLTLNAILTTRHALDDLAGLSYHLRPCSSSNTSIPILTAGTELVDYLSTATARSVALVKMPTLHPDVYAYLVKMSPFPYLYEGRSSLALLRSLGRPGIRTNLVSGSKDRLASIVDIFRQFLDRQSPLWQEHLQWQKDFCTAKNDLLFDTLIAANEYLKLESTPVKNTPHAFKQLSPPELNSQLQVLHYKEYLYSAILPASLISSCNTLYKRKTVSYTKTALLKYGLLLTDGYLNERLTTNAFLAAIDMLFEFGFEREISYAFAIPLLHNFVNWVIYYPASIPEAKKQITEMATSAIGATVGKVCGRTVINLACNCSGWFYRRWQAYNTTEHIALPSDKPEYKKR